MFVKMLLAALGSGSEGVFVDLLTYADLVRLELERYNARASGSERSIGATSRKADAWEEPRCTPQTILLKQSPKHGFSSRKEALRDPNGAMHEHDVNYDLS